MSILLFILGIILFIGLVVIHELGHAIAARRNGVEVEEFGIGFPPRAWGKKLKNGTLFSLNWLPLGGFVKLKGEHSSDTEKGSFGAAPLWAKVKIMLAGVAMNWLGAVVIFTILALVGIPKVIPSQYTVASDTKIVQQKVLVATVSKGSPAEKAGLQVRDQLLSIGGTQIANSKQLVTLTKGNAGKTVEVVYDRKGEKKTAKVTMNKTNENKKGFFGVGPGEQILQRSTWSAPVVGVGLTVQFTKMTFEGLGTALANLGKGIVGQFSPDKNTQQAAKVALDDAKNNVAGPVGIFNILWQSSDIGIVAVLFLIGIISLTLAVMNVLPIPALDGGSLYTMLLFKAFRKPLTREVEERIQAVGFLSLMALIILITIVDVGRLAK